MKDFNDMSYWDKRKVLNEKYNTDMNIFVQTSFIANEIRNKIDKPLIDGLNTFENIVKLLIEGYVVTPIKKFRLIDGCNLVLNVKDDKIVWEEWEWKDIVNTYNFNEIYYLSYDSNKYVSLVHQIMCDSFNIENDIELSDLINSIVNIFTEYDFDINKVLEKEDDTISRIFKLNKLNGNR